MPNNPPHHFGPWLSGCTILCSQTQMVVQKARFISIFVDGVTFADCQSWLSVHVYLVDGWKCNLTDLGVGGQWW